MCQQPHPEPGASSLILPWSAGPGICASSLVLSHDDAGSLVVRVDTSVTSKRTWSRLSASS